MTWGQWAALAILGTWFSVSILVAEAGARQGRKGTDDTTFALALGSIAGTVITCLAWALSNV